MRAPPAELDHMTLCEWSDKLDSLDLHGRHRKMRKDLLVRIGQLEKSIKQHSNKQHSKNQSNSIHNITQYRNRSSFFWNSSARTIKSPSARTIKYLQRACIKYSTCIKFSTICIKQPVSYSIMILLCIKQYAMHQIAFIASA